MRRWFDCIFSPLKLPLFETTILDVGKVTEKRKRREEENGKVRERWARIEEPERKIRFHIPSSFSHTAYFTLSLIVTWFLRSNDFYYIAIWTMNNWIWARKFATNWTRASFPNSSKPNHRFALLTFSSPDVGSQSLISSILLFFSLSSRSRISSFSSSVIPFRHSFFLSLSSDTIFEWRLWNHRICESTPCYCPPLTTLGADLSHSSLYPLTMEGSRFTRLKNTNFGFRFSLWLHLKCSR